VSEVLCVPALDEEYWPTLGPQVCEFIERYLVFGPGDLRGEPAVLDDEKRALIHRLYEVYPLEHMTKAGCGSPGCKGKPCVMAGRRRFKRAEISVSKGWAKTEMASWIAACELHQDAPVRCVSWGLRGDPTEPVGDGVRDPYIPMMAYTEEQTEELAFGTLCVVLDRGPLASDFDIGLERVMRIRGDGKAEPVASAPSSNDGMRTTFQSFDETHRFILPRQKAAFRTMQANIPKRYLADAWGLETTTAFSPGEGSVAEDAMDYARAVAAGKTKGTDFFFFHRQAGAEHDLTTQKGLRAAVVDAKGQDASKFADVTAITRQWDDPTQDPLYLDRVWLNIPKKASGRAFDVARWKTLARPGVIVGERELITLGFDGSRSEDSTGIVGTRVADGYQWMIGIWEKPYGPEGEGWTVPATEVDEVMREAFERYNVWRLYADPYGWGEWLAAWSAAFGDQVVQWATNQWTKMAVAVKNYANAIALGEELTHDGNADFERHIGNACRRMLNQRDADGVPLWVIQKERGDSPMKIDLAMAGCLSWRARLDAVALGLGGPAAPVLPIGYGNDEDAVKPQFATIRGQQF
jgi:phage terminase large subunit-like protein